MGWSYSRFNHLLFSILLIILSITQSALVGVGKKTTFKHLQKESAAADNERVVLSSMIGSRPPSCERRCIKCGHCEAVQVPASIRKYHTTSSSDYKPLSWKCKCGDRILNP